MLIDGIDVASLPLAALRRAWSSCRRSRTIRGRYANLDPWQSIRQALQATKMLG